jgi:hypothetical protein
MGTSLDHKLAPNTFHPRTIVDDPSAIDTERFAEKHFRIGELAEKWRLGRETIRKIIKDEPGVILIRQGRKKAHTTYSVPESVARRIHTRLTRVA